MKKWGLAPMTGSLAPPPPYGSEQGSILLETGRKDGYTGSYTRGHGGSQSVQLYPRQGGPGLDPGHTRTRSGNFRVLPPTSPGPQRSPTDISLSHLVPTEDAGEPSSAAAAETHNEEGAQNAGLGVHDPNHPPPPEYTSPEHSDAERDDSDDENRPLINISRSRNGSLATVRARSTSNAQGRPIQQRSSPSPPIPSYQDAILQGAGRDRSGSAMSSRSARSGRTGR